MAASPWTTQRLLKTRLYFALWTPTITALSLKRTLRAPAGKQYCDSLSVTSTLAFIMQDLEGLTGTGLQEARTPEKQKYEYFTSPQVKGHLLGALNSHANSDKKTINEQFGIICNNAELCLLLIDIKQGVRTLQCGV